MALYESRHRSYPSRVRPPSLAVLPVSDTGAPKRMVPSKLPLNAPAAVGAVVGLAATAAGALVAAGAAVGAGAAAGALQAASSSATVSVQNGRRGRSNR